MASALADGLFEQLATTVPFDGAFLAAFDPATLLYTRAFRWGMPAEASPAFLHTEFGVDDVNQLRHLVQASSPVGWLDSATHGDRMASRRYRLAMRPFGLGDELRVALMIDGRCWGLLCLHRAHACAGFDPHDARLLARIGPTVAGALRRGVVGEQALSSVGPDGPGVLVLNADRTVESATSAGSCWLADLDRAHNRQLPTAILAVVEQLAAPLNSETGPPERGSAPFLVGG